MSIKESVTVAFALLSRDTGKILRANLIGLNFARLNFRTQKIREIGFGFNFASERSERFRVDLILQSKFDLILFF